MKFGKIRAFHLCFGIERALNSNIYSASFAPTYILETNYLATATKKVASW